MNNSTSDQSPHSLDVTAIGLACGRFADLNAFFHFLLTGETMGETVDTGHIQENKKSAVDFEVVERIVDCLKAILTDLRRNGSDLDLSETRVIIHQEIQDDNIDLQSFLKEKSREINITLGFAPVALSVISRPFGQGIADLFSKNNAEKSQNVIFISVFNDHHENPANGFRAGAAGIFFSAKEGSHENTYCRLSLSMQPDERETCLDFTEPVSPGHKKFLNIPIIRMIGAALEIKSRSRFSLLNHTNTSQPLGAQNISGHLIRPWFLHKYEDARRNGFKLSENTFLEILEAPHSQLAVADTFSALKHFMFPIPFNDPQSVINAIDGLISRIERNENIAAISKDRMGIYAQSSNHAHTLVIIGSDSTEITADLKRARSGIPQSIESGKVWQTPGGSFFTPTPLGREAKIAFVFPGAFNTYVGMGSELFFLFPGLYEQLEAISDDPARTINADIIFPPVLDQKRITDHQEKLFDNPTYMISSGVCFSFLFTKLLGEYFGITPSAAFGYSLGENSMMFAMGVWSQADAMRTSLEVSPIFHTRVSGEQRALREFWDLPTPQGESQSASIWANYVVMSTREKVEKAIADRGEVFITHINTDRQVVIGGKKTACEKVLESLNCMHLQAPYDHAIHCPPVSSEYSGFQRLHDWPVECESEIPIFSAADYQPLRMESDPIAESFAKMLTNPVDFPRLVERAYRDGSRVFIELGAGSNCAKWISAVLKGKPHLSVSINQVNVSDHQSILRMLARLISYQIPLNLEALGAGSNE